MTRYVLSHLEQLEHESVQILREVAAAFRRPVLLYSIGKDSTVLLHLARKAFHPGRVPFPLLHVNTLFKFHEMIAFRDQTVRDGGLDLIEWVHPARLTPFTHGVEHYTRVMKTEALKQALEHHGFDAAIGGARRDEERSRAKERIFSFRDRLHRWDPRQQRPEPWRLYNTLVHPGESVRVFPLSNWTELDVWLYLHLQQIPVVPLYFAAQRPVVERDGTLIVVDDERLPLQPGERPELRTVRFRTLGCYPLTGAVESSARSTLAILGEVLDARYSERQGRVIDRDEAGSMESKKREGYF